MAEVNSFTCYTVYGLQSIQEEFMKNSEPINRELNARKNLSVLKQMSKMNTVILYRVLRHSFISSGVSEMVTTGTKYGNN